MTVKELIKHLKTGEQSSPVVVLGYFGEPYYLDKFDFIFEKIKAGENPQGLVGHFLVLHPPSIGEEPD